MEASFLAIQSIGLIGEDSEKGPFRQVIFKELQGIRICEMLVYRKERPMLWSDLEKLECGGQLPPYRGSIVRHNSIDIVVFEGETVESAFEKQRWKLHIRGRLRYEEAEQKRQETIGYVTDLTFETALDIAWKPIDKKARLIKFRYYKGKGQYDWGGWHEITT